MRTAFTLALLILHILPVAAQAPTWLEDQLYGGGKLNAVIAVVSIILLGIGIWLWAQDRRLKRMEKAIEKKPM